jgi:hypothetical protein
VAFNPGRCASNAVGQDEFLELNHGRAKVDEPRLFEAGGAEVAQHLRRVLVRQLAARLQLDDQLVLDQQIGVEIPEQRAGLVVNRDGVLLADVQAGLAQPAGQGVLVDLFDMTMPQKPMGRQRGLPDGGAELEYLFPVPGPRSCASCAFCGQSFLSRRSRPRRTVLHPR